MKYENIKNYSDAKFRRISGMRRKTFSKAIEKLNKKYAEEHSGNIRGSGRKSKLSMEDKLLATLEYLREYRTLAHIAASYDIHESNIQRIVIWVENTLISDGIFRLPGKATLLAEDCEYEIIQIDATESPIERPKKNRKRNKMRIKNRKNEQKRWYSGKKKRHTTKTLVVVCKKSRNIICVVFCNGKKHDFRLFTESEIRMLESINAQTDTGFIGIENHHKNSTLPHKKPKGGELTQEQKRENRAISSSRVSNEHAIGFVKRFKILNERYRGRRKRFGLRFNLIAGICNSELIN